MPVEAGKKTTGVNRSAVWIGPDGRVVKHWKSRGPGARSVDGGVEPRLV